ncbi:MAG: glycosyltransferase family 9 protein [Sedimentisphaerales bacterium]|nr:glycosyltransferase family 9 protein [Sedimentisphaerales bacterium]
MEPSIYRSKWLDLKNIPCPEEELSRLSRQVAFSFIDRYYQDGSFEPEYIDLLCEMATSFSDMQLNNRAAAALFEIIVEELCDDYEEMPVEIYSRVMSQVITYCRNVPAGTALDKRLTDFGISSFEELNHRSNFIHSREYKHDIEKPPEKIILLSRVTIGADVAILSVIVQRLARIFPQVEIVIIGSDKLSGIFGGNSGIRIHPLNYARRGGLFERFSSWHAASNILAEEMPLDSEENILLIDPDSRISQLGVLPLTHHDNYLFFNSRKCASSGKNARMAELANRWIDMVFGVSGFCFPRIWTQSSVARQARNMACSIRAAGCKKLITINLGIGNNPRKRLDSDFEKKLLGEILKSPQTVVLLDRGFGEDELSRSDSLISYLQDQGHQTANARLGNSEYPGISHGTVGVECSIGEIAALIAECDEFIGYDSACQHIAAAVQTPTLTIFAGSNNKSFIRRWSACGNTQCNIVHVNTLTDPRHINTDEIVMRVMEERTSAIRLSPQHRRKILEIKTPQRKGSPAKRTVDN